jgi:hypothetical protein
MSRMDDILKARQDLAYARELVAARLLKNPEEPAGLAR